MTSSSNTRFLVTAAAFWMGSAALCNLSFRFCGVIYELDVSSLSVSVLRAGLISAVMSWFPDLWSFSALTLAWSRSRYTWRCCGFQRPPPPPLPLPSPLLEGFVIHSALFVQLENSAGLLQLSSSPHPQGWRPFSWILNPPMQPARGCWSNSFCLELKLSLASPPNKLFDFL